MNGSQPDYLSNLMVNFPLGAERFQSQYQEFKPLGKKHLFTEIHKPLSYLDLYKSVFRSDHLRSCFLIKGLLCRDKEKLIQQIGVAINNLIKNKSSTRITKTIVNLDITKIENYKMKKLFLKSAAQITFTVIFVSGLLSGCGPVMKTVTDYHPPTSDADVECVSRAYQRRSICQKNNAIAFQKCSDKAAADTDQAYAHAKDFYTKALETYIIAHERYEKDSDSYEEKKQLLIIEGELAYIRCSNDVNMTNIDKFPVCKKLIKETKKRTKKLYRPIMPAKPYAPNRNSIFNSLRAQCENTAMNCEQMFNQSFRSCGGSITTRQICVSNCD